MARNKPKNEYQQKMADQIARDYKKKQELERRAAEVAKVEKQQELEKQFWEKYEASCRGEKVKLTPWEKKYRELQIKIRKQVIQKKLKDNPLAKFCPNGIQEKVISQIGSGDLSIYLFSAGNGIGKTASMVNVLGNIIWGAQPFGATAGTRDQYVDMYSDVNWVNEWGNPPSTWYNYPIYDKWPYPKTIRIVSDQKNVDDEGAIQEEIDRWWPKKWYTEQKGKYPYRSKIRTNNGWRIEIMTYEMDPKQFESKTIGIHWLDEPPRYSIWGSILSRMRRGGIIIMSMTPLFEAAFLYDEVVMKADEDPTIAVDFGDVEDNCIDCGIRGVLTHENIKKMVDRYPPAEREARKSGKFVSLAGRVHSDFNRDIHVIASRHEDDSLPTRDFILANKHLFQFYQVVDPHDRKWDAVGYYAMDSNLRKYVIDEYPDRSIALYQELINREHDYKELIEQILIPKERAMGLYNEDIFRIMDPRFAQNRSSRGAGKSGLTIGEEWGLAYDDGFETSILDNLTACRNKLDEHLRVAGDGYPMLIFFDNYANNHIYAMDHWLWDRWEGKTGDKRDIKETPQEKNSDFPRLLHYLVIYDPLFEKKTRQTIGWREKLKKQSRSHRVGGWMGR